MYGRLPALEAVRERNLGLLDISSDVRAWLSPHSASGVSHPVSVRTTDGAFQPLLEEDVAEGSF